MRGTAGASIVLTTMLVGFIAVSPVLAQAQLDQPMAVPGAKLTIEDFFGKGNIYNGRLPDVGIQSLGDQLHSGDPGRAIRLPAPMYLPPVRSIPDPVVGDTRVGFFNTAERPLRFTVKFGTATNVFELMPREILTIEIPDGTTATGILSTGDEDEETELVRGSIYMLAAEGGRWIFAQF